MEATYPALMADRLRGQEDRRWSRSGRWTLGAHERRSRRCATPARRTRCGSGHSRFRSTTRRSTRRWAATPRSRSTAGATGCPTSAGSSRPSSSPAARRRCGTRLASELVEERRREPDGGRRRRRRAVGEGAEDGTARFLQGFYSGLAGAGVPAVGVEVSGAVNSAIPAFERSSLSTVDSIENTPGRLALALLLGRGAGGELRREPTATDGVLPLVPAPTTTTVAELTVLVAARDEEERDRGDRRALRARFPGAEVVVADDGSRDGTAGAAEEAGARVVRLPRRGKGQALTLAERERDARARCSSATRTSRATSRRSSRHGADLAVARVRAARGRRLRRREGAARALIRLRTRVRRRGAALGAARAFARARGRRASRSRRASAARRG